MPKRNSVERIEEFVDSRGSTLAVEEGVIRGVKILGLESKNGRSYSPQALQQAAPLYEGAKSNANHADGPRAYEDRMGVIRGVTLRPDGLFADFHFNPHHRLAEQLKWDAEHAPENVGFSHVVEARMNRQNGKPVVEAITRVVCVDLVADPATTNGLFEQVTDHSKEHNVEIKDITVEQLKAERPDLVEVLTGTDAISKLTAECAALTAKHAALSTEHAALKAEKDKAAKALAIAEELKAAKLDSADKKAVSETFLAQLQAAPDAAARKLLIEDRVALRGATHTPITGAPPMAAIGESTVTGKTPTVQETLEALR
jgi:hypothetical protein